MPQKQNTNTFFTKKKALKVQERYVEECGFIVLKMLILLYRAAFDHHAEKRRKRGSLFFRKKKVISVYNTLFICVALPSSVSVFLLEGLYQLYRLNAFLCVLLTQLQYKLE